MIKHLAQYKALARMMLQSIGAGTAIILFLHYAMPAAEHPRILNTMGLLLDIWGVTWVAYDIFPFAGLEEYGADDVARSGIETPEYKQFKIAHVTVGLSIVVIGFFLQILSYWINDITLLLP